MRVFTVQVFLLFLYSLCAIFSCTAQKRLFNVVRELFYVLTFYLHDSDGSIGNSGPINGTEHNSGGQKWRCPIQQPIHQIEDVHKCACSNGSNNYLLKHLFLDVYTGGT